MGIGGGEAMKLSTVALLALCAVGCAAATEDAPIIPVGTGQPDDPPPQKDPDPDPEPQVCADATGVYQVKPAQTNLLFLLDRSGSMHLRIAGTETRWTATKSGLFELFDALPQDTVGGITMFPSGDQPVDCCVVTTGNYIDCSACLSGELPGPENRCDALGYESLPVSMAALGATHLSEMKSFVSSADDEFYWGTPLAPALTGTLEAATQQSLNGVTSIVLLTDGLPTSCQTTSDPDANNIQRALDAASGGAQAGVRTYVLGIDAEAASSDPATDLAINLSALASAGGTARSVGCEATNECAYIVNSDNFEMALATSLQEIALDAISCAFDVPEVNGGAPKYDEVNITVESGGQKFTVLRDTSHTDGWDYLPGNQQVQLYGKSCDRLKSDPDASVEVVVGCETQGI
jgi:hypothetical protein